ncbi:MAG: RNA polymerase sigma factor [Gemmatimonadota bacterium]|nr:MAG: RNA polymerase sigma factor [Gemmatimonadota bacterium]
MQEAHLVDRSMEGDHDAFRQLYEANVDRIYRLTYRIAGDEDLARDYTQEAFVRAYQRLHQFRGESAFSTWLHSIAVSVALNGLRKVQRHRKRERSLDEVSPLVARTESVEPDLKQRLREAIERLPEIYKTVFLMHDLEGYSHGEIANTLDVAEGTSKARLSRARAKLREALGEFAEEYV